MKLKKKGFIKYIALTAIVLILISYVCIFHGGSKNIYLLLATVFAAYMAINLGANDVANNMGPAVGSKALTITKALIIAVIAEALGAIIAGGDVVETIKTKIVDTSVLDDKIAISVMISTLVGSAIWINLATFLKAPVSTTNSVVGGLIGAGLIGCGFEAIKWSEVGKIGASWIISLLLGGVIAVAIYKSIRITILDTKDRGKSAKVWVPVYVGIIIAVFSAYLLQKGLKAIGNSNEFLRLITEPIIASIIGITVGIGAYIFLKIKYSRKHPSFFEDKKKFVNRLFNIPLIFAVALLSFAHGSNDVSNAIGPFALVFQRVGEIEGSGTPIWIMVFGAIGLTSGLAIFGARMIKSVGSEITKLNQTRSFCIALSAGATVLLASALGLPVSSTQITLGAIFGIGLFRVYLHLTRGEDKKPLNFVMMRGILLSWVITIPVSGILSGIAYMVISNI